MSMLIIDAHCHYGPGDGLTGPWDTRASLRQYIKRAEEAGISRTIIFAAFHSNFHYANDLVARKVEESPDQFWGFAFINPVKNKGQVRSMLRKAVFQQGLSGIKVHRAHGAITREICEEAQNLNLPVLYDVMGEVHTVELIAREYPGVNFIIPHLGSFADDWKAQLAFIPLLERHANVFTDSSGVKRFDLLEMAVKRAGAHKVIFGSDGPWLHPAVELEKIYALKLPIHDLKKILGGNILRLIKNKPEVIPKWINHIG